MIVLSKFIPKMYIKRSCVSRCLNYKNKLKVVAAIKLPDRIRAHKFFHLERKWTLTRQEEELWKYFFVEFKQISYSIWISKNECSKQILKTTRTHCAWAEKIYVPLYDPAAQFLTFVQFP